MHREGVDEVSGITSREIEKKKKKKERKKKKKEKKYKSIVGEKLLLFLVLARFLMEVVWCRFTSVISCLLQPVGAVGVGLSN